MSTSLDSGCGVTTITPRELAELGRQGRHRRADRRADARGVPGDARRARPARAARFARSEGRHHGAGRHRRRPALHHLPLGQPGSKGVREVPRRRLPERRQRRGRHPGLGAGGAAGRAGQEDDRRWSGRCGSRPASLVAARDGAGRVRASGLPRPGGVRRGRARLRRGDRHLRHGRCCSPGCPGTRPGARSHGVA